jgi:hypothetical protein
MKPLAHHAMQQLNPKKEKEKGFVLLYHPPHYLAHIWIPWANC